MKTLRRRSSILEIVSGNPCTIETFIRWNKGMEMITMDIIQEIKKRQDKISANTERIFKLQQQNMKLREEIRKLQRGE